MQVNSKYSIVLISLLILTLILPNINAYIIGNVKKNKIEIQFKPDIIIPDDYKTIQEGINNADSEDIIFVRSGVYFENIIVDRKIKIYGENKKNTIINGILNKKSTITIVSPNVVITNFLIMNGISGKNSWDNSGVYIKKSNVTIKDNLIMHNTLGICVLDTAHNLTINNNQFIEDGILLANYEHTKNSFTFESTSHTIKNNTVNGKPLYYFKNKNNFTVNNDAGQVILVNCSNVTIKNTFFTKCDFPVLLYFCDNCVIENITSKETYGEIILFNSTNCIIEDFEKPLL